MKEYKYTINGNKYEVAIGEIVDNIATLTVNGEEFKVEMEPEPEPQKPVVRPVVTPVAPAAKAGQSTETIVKAPLPGVITDILVEVGQEVQEDENVIVLEAMKMANHLQTEKGGKVKSICVQIGQSVMEGEPLVIIE